MFVILKWKRGTRKENKQAGKWNHPSVRPSINLYPFWVVGCLCGSGQLHPWPLLFALDIITNNHFQKAACVSQLIVINNLHVFYHVNDKFHSLLIHPLLLSPFVCVISIFCCFFHSNFLLFFVMSFNFEWSIIIAIFQFLAFHPVIWYCFYTIRAHTHTHLLMCTCWEFITEAVWPDPQIKLCK